MSAKNSNIQHQVLVGPPRNGKLSAEASNSDGIRPFIEKKPDDAQDRFQPDKMNQPSPLCDERRDEQAQKATPGASETKQPREATEGHTLNRLTIFDNPEAVDSPRTKTAHSFDTLSENGGDFGLRASPIVLPALEHTGSDCSMLDMSPIKLSHRHWPTVAAPETAPTPASASASIRQHPGMPRSSSYPHLPERNAPGCLSGDLITHHSEQVSNPYFVIRSCRALDGCTYLLPFLRDTGVVSINLNRYGGHIRRYQGHSQALDPDSMDLHIATQRVTSAICAFGGKQENQNSGGRQASSIFRLKEQQRISSEVDRPIELNCRKLAQGSTETRAADATNMSPHVIADDTTGQSKRPGLGLSAPSLSFDNTDTKIKYRCKLCGQPKQNHDCTFRKSLARSIGVMIYPAVNAFTAAEPGEVAPPLFKMNNFVSYHSVSGSPQKEGADYSQALLESQRHKSTHSHPSTVTPQSAREGGGIVDSPQSSLSTHSHELTSRVQISHHTSMSNENNKTTHAPVPERRAKLFQHAAFAPSASLRPEQYRAVTPFRGEASSNAASVKCGNYQYPAIPLTFGERKRMSDTLFCLSKEIPNITQGCSEVLHEAREVEDWDQAVAELLTQIVVGLYCGEGDYQLEGLRQYLLTLGVSC